MLVRAIKFLNPSEFGSSGLYSDKGFITGSPDANKSEALMAGIWVAQDYLLPV